MHLAKEHDVYSFTCGITMDGKLHLWGGIAPSIPSAISEHRWEYFECQWQTRCGITVHGDLYCWIRGTSPIVRLVDRQDEDAPWVTVTSHLPVACGANAAGGAYCWSFDPTGEAELVFTYDRVPGQWVSLSVTSDLFCGLTDTAAFWCWNSDGSPATIASSETKWRSIADGCGVTSTGSVFCVGGGVESAGVDQANLVFLSGTRSNGFCGIDDGGKAICWGHGNNLLRDGFWSPLLAEKQWKVLVGASAVHCGIDSYDELFCWGGSEGDALLEAAPVAPGWKAIAQMKQGLCAIDVNGKGYCWGVCLHEVCRIPTIAAKWTAISCSESTCCGIADDSALRCWGARASLWTGLDGDWEDVNVMWGIMCVLRADTKVVTCLEGARPATHALDGYTWSKIGSISHDLFCGLTLDRDLVCVDTVRGNEVVRSLGPWRHMSVEPASVCVTATNGTSACFSRHWVPSPIGFGMRQDHDPLLDSPIWSQIEINRKHVFCGIFASNSSATCWTKQKLPPLEAPHVTLDMRFSHLAGISVGTVGVCGFQYLQNRHMCFPLEGSFTSKFPAENEVAIVGEQVLIRSRPDEMYQAVPDSRLSIEFGALSYLFLFPTGVQIMSLSGGRLVTVSPGYTGEWSYFSLNFALLGESLIPQVKVLQTEGPFKKVKSTPAAVCVLSNALSLECDEPFGVLVGAVGGQAQDFSMAGVVACAIALNRSTVCCTEGETCSFLNAPALRMVSMASGVTCGVTMSYEVWCTGNSSSVASCSSTFEGTGWLEIVAADVAICASHVNGRLACTDYVPSASPRLNPSDSIVQGIVGLANVTSGFCNSPENCLSADVDSIPYHDGLVVIDDALVRQTLRTRATYVGARVRRLKSSTRQRLTCANPSFTCIESISTTRPFRLSNLEITSSGCTILEVRERPEVYLVSVAFQAFKGLRCRRSNSSVIAAVAVHDTPKVQIEQSYFMAQGPNPQHENIYPFSHGVALWNSIEVAVSHSHWRGWWTESSAFSIANAAISSLELTIRESIFEDNRAVEGHGGALTIRDLAAASSGQYRWEIANTTFRGNAVSTGDGGAMFASSAHWDSSACFSCSSKSLPGTLALLNCSFANNTAFSAGGALSILGLEVVSEASDFLGNIAGCQGGAVQAMATSLRFNDSNFEGNAVGVPLAGAKPEKLPLCSAALQHGGGAVFVRNCDLRGASFALSMFFNNTAGQVGPSSPPNYWWQGGGLSVHGCRLFINDTSLEGNQVAGLGGSIYLGDSPEASVLHGLNVRYSLATIAGGGLYLANSELKVKGLECDLNQVTFSHRGELPPPETVEGTGGCLVVGEGSTLELHNGDIRRNRADVGAGLHVRCETVFHLMNTHASSNLGQFDGSQFYSMCPSHWLSSTHRLMFNVSFNSGLSSANTSIEALGSGPVYLAVHNQTRALFEGSVRSAAIAVIQELDLHGNVVVMDNATTCTIDVTVDQQSTRPGLLRSSEYDITQGELQLVDFGFTAPDAQIAIVNVSCGAIFIELVFPVARIQPQWLQPPQAVWYPSSGASLLPMDPKPTILLNLATPEILEGVAVTCTAAAAITGSPPRGENRTVSLLNPPPDGYTNAQAFTEVELSNLLISADYKSSVRLTVNCSRGNERLAPLSAVVSLPPPALNWLQLPPIVVTSGNSTYLSIALSPITSLVGYNGVTTCVVSLPGIDSVARIPFLRSQTASMRNGVAEWPDLVITGYLTFKYTLAVNCHTGNFDIPQQLLHSITISNCSAGFQPDAEGATCVPCTGAYYSDGGLEPCRPCPARGAFCQDGRLYLHNGFYPSETSRLLHHNTEGATELSPMDMTTVLYPCDLPETCLASNTSRRYQCATGYTGPLCGVCSEEQGYGRSGTQCIACWPRWASILIVIFLFALALGFLIYVTFIRKASLPTDLSIVIRIGLTFIQMLSSIGQFRAKATQTIQHILGVTDSVGSSVFSFPPVQCLFRVPYYSRFALSVSLPLLVGALIMAFMCAAILLKAYCRSRRKKHSRRQLAVSGVNDTRTTSSQSACYLVLQYFRRRSYLSPVLFVYFLFYNSLSTATTAMFRCRSEVIDGVQHLEVDPAVECYNSGHVVGMVTAGLLAVVFNFVIPLALLFTLRRNASRLRDPSMLNTFGFLYYGYSVAGNLYWWETVVLLRKFLVLAVLSTVSDPYFQSLVGLAILVFFLVLQVHARPYVRSLFNALETLVLTCLVLTQLICLMYFRASSAEVVQAQQSDRVDIVVTVVLLLLNGACLGLLVAVGLKEYRRRRKRQRSKAEGVKQSSQRSQSAADWEELKVNEGGHGGGDGSEEATALNPLHESKEGAEPSPVSHRWEFNNPSGSVISLPWSWQQRKLTVPGRRHLPTVSTAATPEG